MSPAVALSTMSPAWVTPVPLTMLRRWLGSPMLFAGVEMHEALLGLDLIGLGVEEDVAACADGEIAVAAMQHMGAAGGIEEDVVARLDVDGDIVVELIGDVSLAHRAAADMVEAVGRRDGDVVGIDRCSVPPAPGSILPESST